MSLTLIAAGIGFAVATMLAKQGWRVSIIDINEEMGQTAATSINATFYKADVRDWASLSSAFDQTMQKHGRLDFVFANAGITDPRTFYDVHPSTEPPPEPNFSLLDINLKGVVNSAYLAQHYFRSTKLSIPPGEVYDPSLVITSSIAALEIIPIVPLYSAAKSGLVAFANAIAPQFHEKDSIRVSSICPGVVRTSRPTRAPPEKIVPVGSVCKAVNILLEKDAGFGRCLKVVPEGIIDVELAVSTVSGETALSPDRG